jgi:hypothetical protein
MKELQPKTTDKIEIVKQQQKKQTLVLQKKIIPCANHVLFEYDQIKETLVLAEYEPHMTEIHWHEALELSQQKKQKTIDLDKIETISKTKVIQKPNCIYISALNYKNAIKCLKRDYNITYTSS